MCKKLLPKHYQKKKITTKELVKNQNLSKEEK